jgi:hypothetical protein
MKTTFLGLAFVFLAACGGTKSAPAPTKPTATPTATAAPCDEPPPPVQKPVFAICTE